MSERRFEGVPPQERPAEPAKEKKPDAKDEGLLRRIAKHPLAKPLIIAAGLHVPVASSEARKAIADGIEQIVEGAEDAQDMARKLWDRESTVIVPQSEETRAAIRMAVAQREARADKAGLAAFREEALRKIESGNAPTFAEMQFETERLNGVPESDVAAARAAADALVDRFAAEVGESLSAEEARRISEHMYAMAKYDWGQASAVRFLAGGKRNCVAASRAQTIVFEGVLSRLPESERAKWRQSIQKVKQHEIAALEKIGPDGTREEMLLLEGASSQTWQGQKDEPGTANVPLDLAKKALASNGPVRVKATSEPGVEVNGGPDFDVDTDEPASLNIRVVGKLRGAWENVRQAREDNAVPRERTAAELSDAERARIAEAQEQRLEGRTIDFDVIAEKDFDEGMRRIKAAQEKRLHEQTANPAMDRAPAEVDLSDFSDVDTRLLPEDDRDQRFQGIILDVGTTEGWPKEAYDRMKHLNDVIVHVRDDGELTPALLKTLTELKDDDRLVNVIVRPGRQSNGVGETTLKLLLSKGQVFGISLRDMPGTDQVALRDALVGARPFSENTERTVELPEDADFYKTVNAYLAYGGTKATVLLPPAVYAEIAVNHHAMLKDRRFMFSAGYGPDELDTIWKESAIDADSLASFVAESLAADARAGRAANDAYRFMPWYSADDFWVAYKKDMDAQAKK